MKLIGIQLNIAWEDWRANWIRATALIEKARPAQGSLIVLPEMFASGFTMNLEKITGADRGLDDAFACGTSVRFDSYIVAGTAVRGPDGRGRNVALVASPRGRIVAEYQKIHPFSMGKEAEHFTGGDEVETFEWE